MVQVRLKKVTKAMPRAFAIQVKQGYNAEAGFGE